MVIRMIVLIAKERCLFTVEKERHYMVEGARNMRALRNFLFGKRPWLISLDGLVMSVGTCAISGALA